MSFELNLITPKNGDQLERARFESIATDLFPRAKVNYFQMVVSKSEVVCTPGAASLMGRPTMILDPFTDKKTPEQEKQFQAILSKCGRVVAITFKTKGWKRDFSETKHEFWVSLLGDREAWHIIKGEGVLKDRDKFRNFLKPPAPAASAAAPLSNQFSWKKWSMPLLGIATFALLALLARRVFLR